jgi:hypothetical protein
MTHSGDENLFDRGAERRVTSEALELEPKQSFGNPHTSSPESIRGCRAIVPRLRDVGGRFFILLP